MSKELKALREQKQELSRLANKLLADNGGQKWSPENQKQFDEYADQMTTLDQQIDNHQRLLDQSVQDNFEDLDDFRKPKDKKEVSDANRAMDIYMRKQTKDITNDEWELIRNTMSTGTGSEGGYTVQTEIGKKVIEALKDYGAMRRNATQFTTSTGGPLAYPTTDGTAEEGEIVGENSSATDSDVSFGTVPLPTYKFSSKVITVPFELLQDSVVDIQALVFGRARDRIGRHQNRKFTVGSGTGEPFGITVAANVGKIGVTGQTVLVTFDDIVDLVDSLDVAYLESGVLPKFMTNQTLRRTVRKIKDTAGRPIWTPSYDEGISGGGSDLLYGYELEINNHMPTPGANAKSLGFGDISKYHIRDAMDIVIFKFEDSAYIKKGQVGFLAWSRAGGNLIDVNGFKTYQHSAT